MNQDEERWNAIPHHNGKQAPIHDRRRKRDENFWRRKGKERGEKGGIGFPTLMTSEWSLSWEGTGQEPNLRVPGVNKNKHR